MSRKRAHIPGRPAGPRPEPDLVYRNIERNGCSLIAHFLCHGTCKPGEVIDKYWLPNVEIVGPTPMRKVPNDLSAAFARCPQHGLETRPVIKAGCGFDQV